MSPLILSFQTCLEHVKALLWRNVVQNDWKVCHRCARWTCNATCHFLGMISLNREDKIQFIKDGLSKGSLDNLLLTLETHPSGVQDIGLQLSCGVQDLKRPFSSPNYSNNEEVWICPAAQTLFSNQLISRVLEVQMTSIFSFGKLRQFPRISWVQVVLILTLAMMFCSDKKIRIFTKSRCGHPLNNYSLHQ